MYTIMGMYDELKCDVEETREHWGLTFQTKDIEQTLCKFELRKDGLYRLTELSEGWSQRTLPEPAKLNYTGVVSFYTYDENDEWIEYWSLLDHGEVLWIKRKE